MASPLKPPSNWTTPRLTLSPPLPADAGEMFERYARDPRVTRYLGWRTHRDAGETRAFVESTSAGWQTSTVFTWIIRSRESGEFLGGLAVRPETGHPYRVQLGYAVAHDHWRKGIMSEALGAVIEWLRARPEVSRVWAFCDVDNAASAGLLEHLGMTREGVLRRWNVHPNISDGPRDCACYAIAK